MEKEKKEWGRESGIERERDREREREREILHAQYAIKWALSSIAKLNAHKY